MRWIRCLVVVGALIGALLPTVALAQQPDTPKSEAVIEGRWKFTFTRTAVHEQWFDAPPDAIASAQAGIPAPNQPGTSISRVYKFSMSCRGDNCELTMSPDCPWSRQGNRWSGQLPQRNEPGSCHPPQYVRPVSSFTSMTIRVSKAVETADGLTATVLEGQGTFAELVWHWWPEEGATKNPVYANTSDVTLRAKRLDPPPPLPTTTTTSSTTTSSTTTSTTVVPSTTTTLPSTTTSTTLAVVAAPGGEGPVDPEAGGGGTTPSAPVAPAGVPSLAASLRGPDAVSWAIPVVATNALLALALVLLMPFPGELFNRTLDEHYDEVTGWFRRLLPGGRSERSGERRARVRGSWRTLGVVLVAGTLLAGLLDPGFGWNRSTAALLVGAGLGLLGVMAVGLGVSAWFVRRRDTGVALSVRALPGALVVTAACVVLSRVVGFEPGYFYGVLAGLVVGGALSAVDEGKQAALASAVTALVAVVAWLGWSWLQPSLGSDPSFGLTVVDTALATLFVAGLEGLVFGLVPMRFLAGAQVLKWSKLVWGLLFGAGVFFFLQLLAHPGSGYGPTDSAVPFLTAAALFAGFGLVSVGFWGWFRIRDRRQPAQPTPEQA